MDGKSFLVRRIATRTRGSVNGWSVILCGGLVSGQYVKNVGSVSIV